MTRQGAYARECEGVGTLADAGSALLWHPGEEYRITHPVPGGDTCSVFRVTEAGLRELLGAWDPAAADAARPRFPVGRVPLDGPTYLLHRFAMHRLGDSGELGVLEGEELAMTFVRRTLRLAIVHATGGRSPPRARSNRRGAEYAVRVREVVGRRPGVRLTLAGIAAEVGCSPFHLTRAVSAHEGVGVYGSSSSFDCAPPSSCRSRVGPDRHDRRRGRLRLPQPFRRCLSPRIRLRPRRRPATHLPCPAAGARDKGHPRRSSMTVAARAELLRGAPYFPVADVAAAGEYYRTVLGFECEYAAGDPPIFAVYSRSGAPIMFRRVDQPGLICPRAPGRHLGCVLLGR